MGNSRTAPISTRLSAHCIPERVPVGGWPSLAGSPDGKIRSLLGIHSGVITDSQISSSASFTERVSPSEFHRASFTE